ncbi:hypothetical protein CEXT_523481 [Caerostris extrusa]|uniref:Secreted protein n=1 Tax=Caerostris extrusa TaxID=172846 RepID=A0AAV4MGA1_CAEEX|nr:hypothetical protein CEXT_523481 [Caerostris extrusa]
MIHWYLASDLLLLLMFSNAFSFESVQFAAQQSTGNGDCLQTRIFYTVCPSKLASQRNVSVAHAPLAISSSANEKAGS